jgi:hypothetical protein
MWRQPCLSLGASSEVRSVAWACTHTLGGAAHAAWHTPHIQPSVGLPAARAFVMATCTVVTDRLWLGCINLGSLYAL